MHENGGFPLSWSHLFASGTACSMCKLLIKCKFPLTMWKNHDNFVQLELKESFVHCLQVVSCVGNRHIMYQYLGSIRPFMYVLRL